MEFKTETIETDVLIVGGGLAGCMAAIKASETGLNVTIAEKANTRRSGSAATGIDHLWAYIPPVHEKMGWTVEDLIEDHVQAVSDGRPVRRDLLRIMAETSYDRVMDLERFGINVRYDDSPVPGKFRIVHQFHSNPSSFNFDGRTLKPTLTREARKRGIRIVNRVMITDIATEGGHVCGAIGISTREPLVHCFKAKAVVLSTSGRLSRLSRSVLGNNFNRRLSPTGTTGDGKLLALGAGAELVNCEYFGSLWSGLGFKNYSVAGGAPRNTVQPAARIVDAEGNVVIPRTRFYDWKNLGKTRISAEESRRRNTEDRMERRRLLGKHFREGKKPLYLDFAEGTDEEISYAKWSMSHEGKMWILMKYFEDNGVDLKKDKIELGSVDREGAANSAAGVWVSGDCESRVTGLFAAGDELGGVPWSSGPGAITTGSHAGMVAAERAKQARYSIEINPEVLEKARERYVKLAEEKNGDPWLEIEYALQDIMDSYIGEITSDKMLTRGLERLQDLEESGRLWADNPHDLMRCLEVQNLMDCARLILSAAKERKESRAILRRSDFPDRDDKNWNVFLALSKTPNEDLVYRKISPEEKP
ncbi:MAG: FAD-binding protein [Deltaproteobacteria bacterium]|nr:FAD-binding protein [Deltaproteobacteria bacterium]